MSHPMPECFAQQHVDMALKSHKAAGVYIINVSTKIYKV